MDESICEAQKVLVVSLADKLWRGLDPQKVISQCKALANCVDGPSFQELCVEGGTVLPSGWWPQAAASSCPCGPGALHVRRGPACGVCRRANVCVCVCVCSCARVPVLRHCGVPGPREE